MKTHKHSRTKEYNTWIRIRNRCQNSGCQDYPAYGGRGILVCNEWNNSFMTFLADVGYAPSREHSLDRIDNNGNYEPSNVRWATPKEQARNTRRNNRIEHNGQLKTLAEWCETLNLPWRRTKSRLQYGWSVEDAFSVYKFKPGCRVRTIEK